MADPVFFAPSRRLTVGEVATVTGAVLSDPRHGSTEIRFVATASEGREGSLIFVENKRLAGELEKTRAAAVLCRPELAGHVPDHAAALVTETPHRAFIAAARLLFPSAARPGPVTDETGISPAAHLGSGSAIEAGAIVEAGAVVGPGAAVGAGTIVAPGAVIGPQCRIGRDSYVGPGASVVCAFIGDRVVIHAGARIGQDGFGFLPGRAGLEKVPQLGRVVIQDDVEIGANATIDRGAIDDTVIGQGTKIDNLVQIAHNVRIGRCCVIAGQCGISGSVVIGDYAMLGGSVGIADHVTIGAGAQLAAGSGVMHDIPAGQKWGGSPAMPARDWLREVAARRAQGRSKTAGERRNG